MGKRKGKRKHDSRTSGSPSNKCVSGDSDDEVSSSSSTFGAFVSGKLKPIGAYINDRIEMVEQMFQSLERGQHLHAVMPDILKAVPVDELKRMCVDELEGMSKKRIRCFLAGEEMTSSSGTEESSSEDEGDPIAPSSPFQIRMQSPQKTIGKSASDQSDLCQQPDSTSADPECEPVLDKRSGSPAGRDSVHQSEADDFGLEEPLVDIVLEEPSPIPSPSSRDQLADDLIGSDGGESSVLSAEDHQKSTDRQRKEDADVGDSQCESNADDDNEGNEDVELEEGEIPNFPSRRKNCAAIHGINRDSDAQQDAQTEGTSGLQPETDQSMVLDDSKNAMTGKKSNEISQLNTPLEEFSSDDHVDCGEEELIAKIQAEDELLFGDGVPEGSIISRRDDASMKESLEFVEEPIFNQMLVAESRGKATNFSWDQQMPAKPSALEGNEPSTASCEGESEGEIDSAVEPYDDVYLHGADSCSTDELLPPGFEPPVSLSKNEADSDKPTTLDTESSDGKKATSIVPIRTLYKRLKQHREATAKRQSEPKVYGPQLLEPAQRQDISKPAGPELPLDSPLDNLAQDQQVGVKKVKKAKKSTSSSVLTPAFLAELEKKKQEHEQGMREKMELLKQLRSKRQELSSCEHDIEQDLKKRFELGIFDSAKPKLRPAGDDVLVPAHDADNDDNASSTSSSDEPEVSDEDVLAVDMTKGEERHVDVDGSYLDILDEKSSASPEPVANSSVPVTENPNSRFPKFTVSLRQSTSGQLIRSVMEKDDVSSVIGRSCDVAVASKVQPVHVSKSRSPSPYTRNPKHHPYHRSQRHDPLDRQRSLSREADDLSPNRDMKSSRDEASRSRRDNQDYAGDRYWNRGRDRYFHNRKPDRYFHDRYNYDRRPRSPYRHKSYQRRRSHSYDRHARGQTRSRSPSTRSPSRTPPSKSVQEVPLPPAVQPPNAPVVDEAFQRQAELLELELRAKAIRSLMKVQDEVKNDEEALVKFVDG